LGETEIKVSGELMRAVFSFFILINSFYAWGQDSEVDHVALAQRLVKDAYYQRAERTLLKVTEDEKQESAALIQSLWGMIYLHQGQYKKSLQSFDQSLVLGIESKEVHLYRAEALLQQQRWDEARMSLDQVGAELQAQLPFHILSAEIYWRQKQKERAWDVLNQAVSRKLSSTVIAKKKFSYLLEEQLYLSAMDIGRDLLKKPESFQDVLAMASQLRVQKQYSMAVELLQTLQMMRPEKEMVALEMAQNYLAMGESFSAALILENSAKHNNSLAFEASEMLRQVGKSYRARFLNMTTEDPAKRLKQKLALYLEEDDYHSLKFMIPQLQKNQLLEDQEIRYAVAYSLFRTGDFEKSENYLNSIDKDGLFEKSIELKREINHCINEKWACYETI
jgi:thioredoxin-like negative regulator of GroEL